MSSRVNKNNATVAVFLKALETVLNEKGLNYSDLARISGKTKQAMSRLKNGFHNPSLKTQQQLAESLGYTLDDFLKKGDDLITDSGIVIKKLHQSLQPDDVMEILKKTVQTQDKYIEKLEAENAYLKKLLGVAGRSAEAEAVPIAGMPDALGIPGE